MEVSTLLSGLTASQRAAVTSPAAPLCIIAGAGSGKTRVLTRRIAHRCAVEGLEPRHVLALTFTRKAAGELAERLRRLGLRDGITAGTFHAVAYGALRSAWADDRRTAPTLLDRKLGLVRSILEGGSRTTLPVIAVVGEIEWAKARAIAPEDYGAAAVADDRLGVADASVVGEAFARYETEKRRRNLVDFDDLLAECARRIEGDRVFGDAQRWRFRHFHVDEFQDVNPLQLALLRAWLGPSRDLCVVGDPAQAIYGWNGADPSFLRDIAEHFPSTTTVALEDNFRSTPEIVAASRSVLRHADAAPSAPREIHRASGPAPTVVRHPDDEAEAEAVARAVRDRHRPGGTWSDQAVLARTNAQLVAVERALRRAGIPSLTRGGARLVDRPEIKGVLRSLVQDRTPVATLLTDLASDVDDAADDEVRAALGELVQLGREYMTLVGDPAPPPAEFAAWLRALSPAEQPGNRSPGVELATFHAAKGLEWRVVHLVGLEAGFVPISHARRPEQVDEERRLLHVAMSRAIEELHITWAASRRFGDKIVDRRRSPLLGSLVGGRGPDEDVGAIGEPATALSPLDGLAIARASLSGDPVPQVDEPVLRALRVWRDARARAVEAPPATVLSDEALEAIAQRRPRTTDELGAVRGVGPLRATRYGAEVVRIIGDATSSP